MALPQDPYMLLSYINMKLRDNDYKDLSELCSDLEINETELVDKLKQAGFDYMPDQQQFR